MKWFKKQLIKWGKSLVIQMIDVLLEEDDTYRYSSDTNQFAEDLKGRIEDL